jgi:hypothetical protein
MATIATGGTLQFLAHELAKRPVTSLLSSLLLGGLVLLYLDFVKTYIKRPSHFLPKSFRNHFKASKFDAPLVELKPGETYRDVLKRGSALVRIGRRWLRRKVY